MTQNLLAASTNPHIHANPAIRRLAPSPRWTVSDIEKMPIDVRELQDNHKLRGAYEKTATCLMTLDELAAFLPNAANHAFALNVHLDQVVVLDIEKSCPPDVAAELLALPSLYSELSMSGKGYHLLLPVPANFDDFPIATGKTVLKEEHGWYEILLDHWVTFTGIPVPEQLLRAESPTDSVAAWERLYTTLASAAKLTLAADLWVPVDKPEIPDEQTVLGLLASVPIKTLADFNNDDSRFEFSTLSLLNNRLKQIIPNLTAINGETYTLPMQVWLLYAAITERIPHRPKHDEIRNGKPLLLNAASSMVALGEGEKAQAQQLQQPQVGPQPDSTWDRDSGQPFTLTRGPNGWVQGTSTISR